MNTIPNRQVISEVLIELAKTDPSIVVLCGDSRDSASFSAFAQIYPDRFIEVGIAEQNLVSIAAGLASCGKKPFAASPACFLSARSFEQIKIDIAYSGNNVKLIGISGGISYGALGMTHHSTQDIAALSAIPGMRVYLPSDRFQTKRLIEFIAFDDKPAYIRIGRNPVEDIYTENNCGFKMDCSAIISNGNDITIIACGEMVAAAKKAGVILECDGIFARVIDMYCVKPIDKAAVLKAAKETKAIITVEEHSLYGGMGAIISQIVASEHPKLVKNLSLPDEPVITGESQEVFAYYGLDADGIAAAAKELIKNA